MLLSKSFGVPEEEEAGFVWVWAIKDWGMTKSNIRMIAIDDLMFL